MKLTDDDFRELQGIWFDEFQERITLEEARMRGMELIELYSLLARTAARLQNVSEKHQ